MRVTIKHHQAVWETTTFHVDVEDVDELLDLYEGDDLDEMLNNAILTGNATIEQGDTVQGVDSDFRMYDENFREIRPEHYEVVAENDEED